MKRNQLLKYLKSKNCYLLREGANHSVYYNSLNNKTSAVPRHTEIDDKLAKKICKDLDIDLIK